TSSHRFAASRRTGSETRNVAAPEEKTPGPPGGALGRPRSGRDQKSQTPPSMPSCAAPPANTVMASPRSARFFPARLATAAAKKLPPITKRPNEKNSSRLVFQRGSAGGGRFARAVGLS